MPREQNTTRVDETPPASSDPFRVRATGPDDNETAPVDDTTAAETPVADGADTVAANGDAPDGQTAGGDASAPAPEGEWVAGTRSPSVPGQPQYPAAEDAGDDPGAGRISPFGERGTPVTDADFSRATDTTPAVDADSDPSVATTSPAVGTGTRPATDAGAETGTGPAAGTTPAGYHPGTTPAGDTAQLDQPATGAHAAPAAGTPGSAGSSAGLDAVGAAFVADADGYRASWVRIQSAFVDDPRGSVTEAAELITQITGTLVAAVQERERSLRGGWDSGDADTEVLRNALREYRSFFERLMKV